MQRGQGDGRDAIHTKQALRHMRQRGRRAHLPGKQPAVGEAAQAARWQRHPLADGSQLCHPAGV